MARPSDALLAWLRDLIKERGLNTAAVAERAGLPRGRVRKLLAGSEPMLVDELMKLSEALEISPADMGLPDGSGELLHGEDVVADGLSAAPKETGGDDDDDEEPLGLDPFGNHPEQMFRAAFALGCDFFFLADVSELEDSGVPGHVLAQYEGQELPIKLDAAYHSYNEPRYHDDRIHLTLSFDQLYECTFPYAAIKRFVLFPVPPEVVAAPEPPADDDEERSPVPHLRLVT